LSEAVITATSDSRFRRDHRLLTAADFNGVFKNAAKSSDRYFTVLFRKHSGDTARLGFAVAKKRVANATARNRLKRLVRESFRQSRQTLPSLDVVVMANTRAQFAKNTELVQSIEKHWQRLSES